MIFPIPIANSVHYVGVDDRETDLFEGLWPLPRGVSYNAYVIDDEKPALVDTVKGVKFEAWLGKVRRVLSGREPAYVVVNHMEPDHSGSIRSLLEVFPRVAIVGNKKTAEFLERFYGIRENVKVVADGESLDLGKHKLSFHFMPMVHWPESMATYESTEGILFSNDAFGGFGALSGGIFDDEVDVAYYEDEILRYFSNIVGKYSAMVQKAIASLGKLDIKTIAPSHGPVWRKNPSWIVERYRRWSAHEAEEGVVLAYASMYGNTERMMEAVARGLVGEDVARVRIHDVARTHVSYLIRDAWRFGGLILGSPTYDAGLFPPMRHFVNLLEHKKLTRRVLEA
ncbi:MAG TPA: FprA family A-type flavoprotein, partial [bacterium]|nr:FprA family A-type flavoprotein [bacterium]